MSLVATCQCGKSFQAKPELAGKTLKCPSCGSALRVPAAAPAAGIRVACACGKAFSAKPELAGKRVACPACGGALAIPAPGAAAPGGPSVDPFGNLPSSHDPLGLGGFDDRMFAGAPAANFPAGPMPGSSFPSSPMPGPYAGGPVGPAKSSSSNKGLIIGLIVGGIAISGLVAIVVFVALLLPAVQAAREAARRAAAANSGSPPPAIGSSGGVSGSKAASQTWITYNSAADGYSVSLPRQPQLRTQAQQGITISMAVCEMGTTGAYLVATTRLPAPAAGQTPDIEAVLEGGISGAVANAGGQLLSKKNITLDGFPGREISFTGQKGGEKFTAYSRFYAADSVIIQTMFIGPSAKPPGADLPKFLDSFKLLRSPKP